MALITKCFFAIFVKIEGANMTKKLFFFLKKYAIINSSKDGRVKILSRLDKFG